MGLVHTKASWSNKSLVFGWFTSETRRYKGDFCDHAFPFLTFTFACAKDFEHLILCYWADFRDGNFPFACFFFAFLLDGITKDFGSFDLEWDMVGWHVFRYVEGIYIGGKRWDPKILAIRMI